MLTHYEFKYLLELEKEFTQPQVNLPLPGNRDAFDLINRPSDERFVLDVNRSGKIELSKYSLQNRHQRTKLPLVRVDIDSPPHRNPDGTKVSRNHIHIYQADGTGDENRNLPWAYEISDILNTTNYDFMNIWDQFCAYCHIDSSNVQRVM